MALKYLLDENVEPSYKTQLTRCNSDICMWVVGEPNAPARGTLDPEILVWCEEYDFILVTNNRRSMPEHLANHMARGGHIPGIFILSKKLSIALRFIAIAPFVKLKREN